MNTTPYTSTAHNLTAHTLATTGGPVGSVSFRTATARRGSQAGRPSAPQPTVTPPAGGRSPLRWIAPLGIAAVIGAVGFVVATDDAETETDPAPAVVVPASPQAPAGIRSVPGVPFVMFGSVACIPVQHLGPNVDLAPDPTGQRSSGVEMLEILRQRGPNADLAFDPTGFRSSGQDPICLAP